MDLDNFMVLNDTHGHLVGDRVLVDIARTIKNACSPDDVVARMGGNEFGVATPATVEKAADLAEAIRANVEKLRWTDLGDSSVTISCGVATLNERGLRDADEQLYYAKRAGKNRVSVKLQEG